MASRFEMLPLVDMDGILTEDERARIIKRLHSMLSWVGSIIPDKEMISGEPVDLRKTISELIRKSELTKEDLKNARILAKGISERERDLEGTIVHGDITEEEALELLDEARGLLRATEELSNI
jgi:beta-phosphoglucomutase-like phosphatase (HAD superfamily)